MIKRYQYAIERVNAAEGKMCKIQSVLAAVSGGRGGVVLLNNQVNAATVSTLSEPSLGPVSVPTSADAADADHNSYRRKQFLSEFQ